MTVAQTPQTHIPVYCSRKPPTFKFQQACSSQATQKPSPQHMQVLTSSHPQDVSKKTHSYNTAIAIAMEKLSTKISYCTAADLNKFLKELHPKDVKFDAKVLRDKRLICIDIQNLGDFQIFQINNIRNNSSY